MVFAPALVGLAALAFGSRAPRFAGRLGAATAGLGFAGALALAVHAGGARGDEVITAHLGPLTLEADRLAAVLLLLVFGVSAIVQAFAVRYLAGDPRAPWFIVGAGLLTAASAGLMTAGTLVGLAAFWTAAGAALCMLLATYWHLPAARDGVRRTVIAFAIGDLALWTAVILATAPGCAAGTGRPAGHLYPRARPLGPGPRPGRVKKARGAAARAQPSWSAAQSCG